jgi:hypothetical protein
MKQRLLLSSFAFLFLTVFALPAQQTASPAPFRVQYAAQLVVFKQEEFKQALSEAQSGDREAQYWLALIYDRGKLVPKNHEQPVDWLSLMASVTSAFVTQNLLTPTQRRSYLESWRGQPDKADKIDHASVDEGTIMTCIEVMPVQKDSICNLKYKTGGEITLKLEQSITSTKTDVVYLSCDATLPRAACKVRLTAPKKQTAK